MIKSLLTLLILCIFKFSMIAQVPNGGFEDWTDNAPDEWTATLLGTVSESDDAYSGLSAALLQTDNDETIIPEITSGYDNLGIPVSENYNLLTFHYKFIEDGSDKVIIAITIADEEYNSLGGSYLEIEDSQEEYTAAFVPIEYDETGTAAHAIIQIYMIDAFGTGDAPSSESSFLVDGVELSIVNEVIEFDQVNTFNVYPNPSSDIINIKTSIQYGTINIIDITGKVVYSELYNNQDLKIDVSTFEKGIYFVQFEGDKESFTSKLIVD